jgi:hypothetical protein
LKQSESNVVWPRDVVRQSTSTLVDHRLCHHRGA